MLRPPRTPTPSLPMESIAKINQAVDACLERCAGSAVPDTALQDFLKELEVSGDLTPDEIKTVEQAAARALG